VLGTVPDVRPALQQAAAVVVPLLVGGGTRIKIFEAMAMGRPVVSTSLGAEGLPVTSGEQLLLADEPQAFADAVCRLLEAPAEAARLGAAARQYVEQHFTVERIARQFEAACVAAVNRGMAASGTSSVAPPCRHGQQGERHDRPSRQPSGLAQAAPADVT
jgi:glycosyltransferase involved in cell wall biosynthesis